MSAAEIASIVLVVLFAAASTGILWGEKRR